MSNKNLTGGSFDSAPPKDFFKNNDSSEGELVTVSESVKPAREPLTLTSEQDLGHLSDYSRIVNDVTPSDQFLCGGVWVRR